MRASIAFTTDDYLSSHRRIVAHLVRGQLDRVYTHIVSGLIHPCMNIYDSKNKL
jgi:hypothetical protein